MAAGAVKKVSVSNNPNGRPRQNIDKALLDAATEEFLEYGFIDANIERIAKACNISKPTLYKRFSTKEKLFEAVLENIAEEFRFDLSFLHEARPAKDVVFDLVLLFHERLGTPRVLAMTRLGVSESTRFPELMFRFRAATMSKFMGELTAYFDRLNAQRIVNIEDTLDAAIILTTLASRLHERILGAVIPLEKKEAHLRELVRFFIAGYAPVAAEVAAGHNRAPQ